MAGSKHFYELDSLRGVAAITVVLHHGRLVFGPQSLRSIDTSLLRLVIPGHEAVVLFFVLSGFVLTLPYQREVIPSYGSFLVKRVCRIYLPYLGALALAIAGAFLFHHAYIPFNSWANVTWSHAPTGHEIVQHLFFIGDYNWSFLNTAFWSIVQEMRISLIFPLIAFFVLRARSLYAVLLALALSICGSPAVTLAESLVHGKVSLEALSRSAYTVHFAAFFIAGSVLAKHLHQVNGWYARLTRANTYLFSILSVCLYAGGSLLNRLPARLLHASDECSGVGAVMLIILALNADSFSRFLRHSIVHYLGKISYSIYLLHGTVLFALIGLFYGRLPFAVVLPFYLLITLALSALFYRFVEMPSIALGRRLEHLHLRQSKLVLENGATP